MAVQEQIEPTIETVTPGDVITGYEYDLIPGVYANYVDASAISPGWLRLPDGRQAVPHSVLFEDSNRTFSTRYLSGRKLNAGVRHVFYGPIVPPIHVVGSVEILKTYIRRGREHVEFMARVHDGDGRLLLASHNNWVMNTLVTHDADQAGTDVPAPVLPPRQYTLPVSERALAMQPGEELAPFERTSVLNEPNGGFGDNSVHGDEYARRVLGLRGGVTLGSTNLGYINELLGRQFGPSWLERGSLDVRFIGGVVRNDQVAARARVTGRVQDDEGERLDIEVWLTNETLDSRTAIVGSASYRL